MKVLKVLAIIAAVLVGLFYGGGFLLPSDYGMERSAVINAPAKIIFEQVNNLENWPNWSPWSAMDPNMKVTYTDQKSGVGANYSWEGEETGKGSLTIMKSEPYSNIENDIVFEDSEGIAKGNWTFEPVEGGVKTTWRFSATASGITERYFGLLIDTFLGTFYESGLNSLKEVAEAAAINATLEKEKELEAEAIQKAAADSLANAGGQ